jgi:hypothetical protein
MEEATSSQLPESDRQFVEYVWASTIDGIHEGGEDIEQLARLVVAMSRNFGLQIH